MKIVGTFERNDSHLSGCAESFGKNVEKVRIWWIAMNESILKIFHPITRPRRFEYFHKWNANYSHTSNARISSHSRFGAGNTFFWIVLNECSNFHLIKKCFTPNEFNKKLYAIDYLVEKGSVMFSIFFFRNAVGVLQWVDPHKIWQKLGGQAYSLLSTTWDTKRLCLTFDCIYRSEWEKRPFVKE